MRVLGSGQVPGAGGAHLLSLSGSCSPPHRAHRALGPGVQHRGGALLGAGLHHPRGRDAGADLPGHGPSSATGEPPPPVPACPGACLTRSSVPGSSGLWVGCWGAAEEASTAKKGYGFLLVLLISGNVLKTQQTEGRWCAPEGRAGGTLPCTCIMAIV